MHDHKKYEAHVFICTNSKLGACCAEKGSVELREKVKKLAQDPNRGWHGRVRVNASGCLGQCEHGITAVIYPKGEWFTGLTKDSEKILEEAIERNIEKSGEHK